MSFNIKCCKDCEKRKIKCHSICDSYRQEKQRHDEVMKKIKTEKKIEQDLRTKKDRKR